MIIFIEAKKGRSEKGNDYNVVKLVQIKDEVGKEIVLREFFCDPKKDFSMLHFGDVVQPVFEDTGNLGERPRLVKVDLVSESPYLKMLAEENG